MNPPAQSSTLILAFKISVISSVGTSVPFLTYFSASAPSGVPSSTSFLSKSPEDILGTLNFSEIRVAWVPFPDPWGPIITNTSLLFFLLFFALLSASLSFFLLILFSPIHFYFCVLILFHCFYCFCFYGC